MHYLIDGHNLIAQMPDIDLSDPDDEAQLLLRLKSWTAADPKRRVTVYFDGGLPGGRSAHFSGGPVQVIFASAGSTADALLMHRIRQVKNPPEYTLVSGDREITAVAEKRRMPFFTADEFATQLIAEAEVRARPAPPDPEEPQLSAAEVAEWLELFGPEPQTPSRPPTVPRGRAAQGRRRARGEKQRKKTARPADELKASGDRLTADEIEEWLDFFAERDDS